MSREALESHSMNLTMKLSNHSRSIWTPSTKASRAQRSSDTFWCSDSHIFSIGLVRSLRIRYNSSARQCGSWPIPVDDQIDPPWYFDTMYFLYTLDQNAEGVKLSKASNRECL
jgi:hypothetical protein